MTNTEVIWPSSDLQRQHDRGVPSRGTWLFDETKQHRWRIRIDQGVSIECVDPCENPVIQDFPDEDRVVVCTCARPIEEPSYEINLEVTATLRYESFCTGGHQGGYCDCDYAFVAENIEESS